MNLKEIITSIGHADEKISKEIVAMDLSDLSRDQIGALDDKLLRGWPALNASARGAAEVAEALVISYGVVIGLASAVLFAPTVFGVGGMICITVGTMFGLLLSENAGYTASAQKRASAVEASRKLSVASYALAEKESAEILKASERRHRAIQTAFDARLRQQQSADLAIRATFDAVRRQQQLAGSATKKPATPAVRNPSLS